MVTFSSTMLSYFLLAPDYDIKGTVRFNAGYRGGLEWEGVLKTLLRNDWGTKLLQTIFLKTKNNCFFGGKICNK